MDSGDDTRKKRECPHGAEHGREDDTGSSPDNCKKLRAQEDVEKKCADDCKIESKKHGVRKPVKRSGGDFIDIESALHRLFDQEGTKERLSNQTAVTFRAGHAGDAPAIASCFKHAKEASRKKSDDKTRRKKCDQQESSSPSLELSLSEAMGDEDTPPSIFSILADISPSSKEEDGVSRPTKRLGAVALFNLTWKENQRMLRMEWLHVNKSLPEAQVLERRIWLRLSSLALMTGACLCVPANVQIDNVEVERG